MKKFTMFACLALALVFALSAFAQETPVRTKGNSTLHGGSAIFNKADLDTINLMAATDDPTNNVDPRDGGNEPYYDGDFEDDGGNPHWNGWTSVDLTDPLGETAWNVATTHVITGLKSAWCGDITLECGGVFGMYGKSWDMMLEFSYTMPNLGDPTTVDVYGDVDFDTETGYDYSYLSYRYEGQNYADMNTWEGIGTDTGLLGSVVYNTADYFDGTDVKIFFRLQSDGGADGEDCYWPGHGLIVDNIDVHLVNAAFDMNFTENFETSTAPDDFGPYWAPQFPEAVGDFAAIWSGLEDNDYCNTNYSPQVGFIDDGNIVAGTGGSECVNWCYGPSGYIVSTTGGLGIETERHIHNAIESPEMAWPASKNGGVDDDGIILTFSVYRHEDLSSDSPGTFYQWGVRSAVDLVDLPSAPWSDRNFVYYGGPDYVRAGDEVTDLMVPGRNFVQVQLSVWEYGYNWGWNGHDGYPAPYFDNVTVKVFPYNGPGMASREIDFAQDNFPARGSTDLGNPDGSHSIRFDMARNISNADHLRNDPGDSIIVDCVPVRTGATLVGNPIMVYKLNPNPVFNPYRGTFPLEGEVPGEPAVGLSGTVADDRYAFDLPDTGFFYPGDVIHWFLKAQDVFNGDIQESSMPADTAGFASGWDPMGYNSTYTTRGLPSVRPDGFGGYEIPEVLWINDFANRGGENEWYTALNNLGLLEGDGYDTYYVSGPSSGVGNGIGGRTGWEGIQDYNDILYTSGDLSVNTIANGDYENDAGDDVGTLMNWLDAGDKDIFLTGDDMAADMAQAGVATGVFLESYLGINVITNDVRPFIGTQTTPLVLTIAGNEVFNRPLVFSSWIAYGGCLGINTFDGVEPRTGTIRLAEYADPAGQGGQYSFSAVSLNKNIGTALTSRAITMTTDLMYVYTDPNAPANRFPGRTLLLEDVLRYFNITGDPNDESSVPGAGIAFQTSNYPNPFNPSTTIKYSMPKAGHLTLSIYNVRGQLVKTMIDGTRPAGADQTIVWDGTNNQGASVSSGVYFYEARTGGDVKVKKMALVK